MATPHAAATVLFILVAAGLAGCFGSKESPEPAPFRADAWPHEDDYVGPVEPYERVLARRPIELKSTGCQEAGPHSIDSIGKALPSPWVARDVKSYIGGGLVPRLEGAMSDNVTGVYHAIVVCDTWSINGYEGSPFVWGFIGTQVEPPPFDDGAAAIHYLVHTLTVASEDLRDFLRTKGFNATMGRGLIESEGPFHRTVLQDDERGTTESLMKMRQDRPKEAGTVRLWMLTQNWDGSWSPVALDLRDQRGEHWVADGYAVARATGNQTQDVQGDSQLVAGLLFTGFDRTITFGPTPDVRLSQAWRP